jgi:hypothetical protein
MENDEPFTLADAIAQALQPLEDGHKWGEWRLHGRLLVHDDPYYDIPLDEIETSGQMLDWVIQLSQKNWLSKEQVGYLVEAFDEIFHPQRNLCGFGAEERINAEDLLRRRLKFFGA